jgi:hypothetical protein
MLLVNSCSSLNELLCGYRERQIHVVFIHLGVTKIVRFIHVYFTFCKSLLYLKCQTVYMMFHDVSGLDDCIARYAEFFVTSDVTGAQLFAITSDELMEMGVMKIGHQEMLLNSISLLEAIVSWWLVDKIRNDTVAV